MFILEVLGWSLLFLVIGLVLYYVLALLVFMVAKFGALGFYEGRKRFRLFHRKDVEGDVKK